MCLFTTKLEPYIAKEDIMVYKELKRDFMGYKSPMTNYPIELDTTIIPEGDSKAPFIKSGYIHASIRPRKDYSCVCKVAYIPKGTEFYMADSMASIAAKKLYVTSTDSYNAEELLTESQFAPYVIDDYNSILRIGDLVTIDNKILHLEEWEYQRIKGIYAGVVFNTALFVNTDIRSLPTYANELLTKEEVDYVYSIKRQLNLSLIKLGLFIPHLGTFIHSGDRLDDLEDRAHPVVVKRL